MYSKKHKSSNLGVSYYKLTGIALLVINIILLFICISKEYIDLFTMIVLATLGIGISTLIMVSSDILTSMKKKDE